MAAARKLLEAPSDFTPEGEGVGGFKARAPALNQALKLKPKGCGIRCKDMSQRWTLRVQRSHPGIFAL